MAYVNAQMPNESIPIAFAPSFSRDSLQSLACVKNSDSHILTASKQSCDRKIYWPRENLVRRAALLLATRASRGLHAHRPADQGHRAGIVPCAARSATQRHRESAVRGQRARLNNAHVPAEFGATRAASGPPQH